jgi:hypothetical protein
MDRLDGAVDILEILGVDARKDDTDKVALGVLEAPGKDDGLLVVDPVNGRDRCYQLAVPPIARLPKEIAADDVKTCSRPTGRRADDLPFPIGNRNTENLRQAAEIIRQRFLEFTAVDGGLKVGGRIDVVPLRRLLDLEQHGVDRLERARQLDGKNRRDVSRFGDGGTDGVGAQLPDRPNDGTGRKAEQEDRGPPKATQRNRLNDGPCRRFGHRCCTVMPRE